MSGPPIPPICEFCERYKPGIEDPAGTARCAAFPDGIPSEITQGLFDHRHRFAQEQMLFKAAPGVTEEQLNGWLGAKQMLQEAAGGAYGQSPQG